MIFYILSKLNLLNKQINIIIGTIIYFLLLNNKFIRYYSSLIIPLDLYLVNNLPDKLEKNDNLKDMTEYKEFIKKIYYKYKEIKLNEKIELDNDETSSNKYINLYKPTDLKLEHTIKHTLNNIN